MSHYRTRASFRAMRARVAACLRSQAGDTMIEVTIAALLVALIATATFSGYSSIAHVAAGQNTRAQASSLAESDQARLHGLSLSALSSASGSCNAGVGNTNCTSTVDNTVYTISSSTQFVSGAGAASCTTSGTTTADEVQTTSTVTWPGESYAGGPVEIHGLVTPPQGGSLIVRVLDVNGNGVSGATVGLSGGPTSVTALTTDSNGCVEFGGLSGGDYTVTATVSGTNTTASATVVATQTKTVTMTPSGGNGAISATFTTSYNGSSHASSADQVTAWNPVQPSKYNVFGTAGTLGNNTYQSTVTSSSQFAPGSYTVFAGSCAGDYSDNGYQIAAVTNGTTQNVVLPVPAMIVDVWNTTSPTSTEYDDTSSAITYSGSFTHATGYTGDYNGTESWSNTAGNTISFTFTGTSIQWITSLASNHGFANVSIDGSVVDTNLDTYGASAVDQIAGFSDSGLSSGSHTITITVDGTRDASSSNTYVTTDAFIVGTAGTSAQVDDPPSSSVVYSGSGWTHGSTGSQNYDSTESFDQTTGDSVQFTFTGTSIEWLAPVSTNAGYANIYLDGTLVASNVTAYSSTVYRQIIWSDAGLANTTHTLKIVVDGTKPSGSSAYYVPIDSFVYGTLATGLLTTAPLVTLADNNTPSCNGNENYPATQVPTLSQGALVDPGQPYGNWTVCASSGGLMNTATVANTSYTSGNVVNIYLATGASGLQSGSCT